MSAQSQKHQNQKNDTKKSASSSSNHTPVVKQKYEPVQSSRSYHTIFSGLFWVCIVGLFMLAAFNIIASQLVHPLYFSFINEDRDTVVTFLEKTRRLDVYPRIETQLAQSIQVFEEDVLMNDTERNQTIAELEAVLEQNEKARDVLIALAALYNEAGNEEKYEEYKNRAREVDPGIAD
jgi:cell division protein FtsI/penicillin-binding protein 2